MDHQPCSTNDMNSPRVTGVRQQMRSSQPGHKCNSPPLACEGGSDPRGHLWVTWGVYLWAGKPPLADIILSHPPDLT